MPPKSETVVAKLISNASSSTARHRVVYSPEMKSSGAGTMSKTDCTIKGKGPILYWMSRDQRVADNWALLHAQHLALASSLGTNSNTARPLGVVFCLAPSFLGATIRQFGFMLKGLAVVEQKLKTLNIPFFLLRGDVTRALPEFASSINCSAIVTDFNPLRIRNKWVSGVAEGLATVSPDTPLIEVDAHNIVPCWVASDKLEFAAKTIRPKINAKLDTYLTDIPAAEKMPPEVQSEIVLNVPSSSLKTPSFELLGVGDVVAEKEVSSKGNKTLLPAIDWEAVRRGVIDGGVDDSIGEVDWREPGEDAALAALHAFLHKPAAKIHRYATDRNDPNVDGQSNLSPYFHFGQLSPQRAAFSSLSVKSSGEGPAVFREELIIRRELADNLCFYNVQYDSFEGLQQWAKDTLTIHAKDKREYVYSLKQLEDAQTRDPLWNAAQKEMVKRGKMHGFMRMYWAKKVLEWSATPQEALSNAIYLNDKYFLDGRDPNGYAGITWSIGGTHDWGWTERNVFGKIRFMNFAGCKRKFDVKAYCTRWLDSPFTLPSNADGGSGTKKVSKVPSVPRQKGTAKKRSRSPSE